MPDSPDPSSPHEHLFMHDQVVWAQSIVAGHGRGGSVPVRCQLCGVAFDLVKLIKGVKPGQ